MTMNPTTDDKQALQEKTGLGNYFVANYPPFSAWKPEYVPDAIAALNHPPKPGTPLGLYLHIPFCRKRCKFCYFRVYTDKNAQDIEIYLDALAREIELYSKLPIIGGRPLHYFYFGGGTPSYLSSAQLKSLVDRLQKYIPWHNAAEVTFECEPGTLQQHKLETIKEIGVTRLSFGFENFDDDILRENGRAHLSAEIARAYEWAKQLGFNQINIDLIAGMVGETWANWKDCIQKTIELDPDSVTIYQMELPFNTVFSKELKVIGQDEPSTSPSPPTPLPQGARGENLLPSPLGGEGSGVRGIADWPTKRDWVNYAFDTLAQAGYQPSSAYTMVKDKKTCKFVYRDSLWHGADMFGTGVASFGHVNGVHVQNVDTWERYIELLNQGQLPLGRALPVTPKQLLIREMILQLKTGSLDRSYFQKKFSADILHEFAGGFRELEQGGNLTLSNGSIQLTRQGLLQVDRLLPVFFEPEYQHVRYT